MPGLLPSVVIRRVMDVHEMVLVHRALDIVLQECEGQDVAAVTGVHLIVGEATDVMEEFVGDMFRFLARGTVAENARLVVERMPLAVRCNRCSTVFPIKIRQEETWRCPTCGAFHDYVLVSGREFVVDRIDVERAVVA